MATTNLGMGQSDLAAGKPLVHPLSQAHQYAVNSGMGTDTYMSNIKNWLTTNNTATDAQVRDEMDKYGISPKDVADAMGWRPEYVAQKYDAQAWKPPTTQPVGSNQVSSYTPNPYLDKMAAGITSQMNDNWTRNLAPSIRSGAMAAGGFGGSRQGVVEANGLNDMNRSLGQNLANLYGTDYTNAQNRNLQQQSINLQQQSINNSYDLGLRSYDLGLRSSDLGFASLDANIANSNFSNQLASANFGLNTYNTLNSNNANAVNAGTAIQNTPLDYQKYFTNSANGVGSGYGTSTKSQTNPGNTALGFLGGAQLGSQFYNTYKG